ncbi:hypothetical protein ABBQ38_006819 [Trebouxia sp. C0009 RCD-2024]
MLSECGRRARLMQFAGQLRQKQTAKQKADCQPGSLYKCNTNGGIFHGIQKVSAR